MNAPARTVIRLAVTADDPPRAIDLLAARSGLSRSALKDAMNKGACWLTRGERRRLRRATAALRAGDAIELHYDAAVLAREPPPIVELARRPQWSGWWKPAGVLSEGTDFGDHCALARLVELRLGRGPVHIVHRLDREAEGVMLVAHGGAAAGRLSRLFSERRIVKRYRATVCGVLPEPAGVIDRPLDGKPARTEYRVAGVTGDRSEVEITLHTGRLHQIRRHFAALGHPVVGDPRYGDGRGCGEPLALVAVAVEFRCPWGGDPVRLARPEPR